jgi:hypothetical protein
MQFFVFDFALAFAVLLGYRALVAVVRRRTPVVALAGRETSPSRVGISRRRVFIQPRGAVGPKAVVRKPAAPTRAPRRELPRTSIHRLINLW